jgi:hypothetical protein
MIDYKNDYVGKKYDTINGLYLLSSKWHCETEGGSRPAIDHIKPILIKLSHYYHRTGRDVMDMLGCSLDIAHEIWSLRCGDIKLDKINHETIQVCYRNHIDIHNLIEQGLAIDIFTIENKPD